MESSSEKKRKISKIIFTGTSRGLGLCLAGGFADDSGQMTGIFVRKIMRGGVVSRYSGFNIGNEILEINRISVKGVSNSRAVELLRRAAASDTVEIVFACDQQSRSKFTELLSLKKKKSISSKFEQQKSIKQVQDQSNMVSGAIPKKIRVMKNCFDVGLKVKEAWIDENKSLQVLEVDAVSPGGASGMDGRLKKGDVLLRFNGVNVTRWEPTQLHSVFLREKLRSDSSFEIEYIPRQTLPAEIARIINLISQDESDDDSTKQSSANWKIPMKLTEVSSMSDDYCCNTSPQRRKIVSSRSRRLTLEQGAMIKVCKLETALEHLGILDPSAGDIKRLHEFLEKDENEMVKYGEFVEAVKEVFRDEMTSINMERTRSLNELDSDQTTAVDKCVATEDWNDEFEETSKRLQEALKEITKLQSSVLSLNGEKAKLHESLTTYLKMLEMNRRKSVNLQEEIENLHRERAKAVNSRVEEISNSQKTETQDQESVGLKPHQDTKDLTDDLDEMRTRASLVDCEYRKANETRKLQEEVIRHLLHFATVTASTESSSSLSDARQELNKLVEEAQQAVAAVKPLLESEELPYGWEEATLPDGSKYFINHSDRTTSWTHPGVEEEGGESVRVHSSEQDADRSGDLSMNYPLITLSPSDSDTQDDL